MVCLRIRNLLFLGFLIFPLSLYASFIETTQGTAVVNDATAAYFNPAALVLLKNIQIIPQGSIAYFHTRFSGEATQSGAGFTQTGSSSSNTTYYSPSFYLGIPTTDKITIGLALVSNSANRDVEASSILRYVQASNTIQDFDLVPAISIKINDCFSLGAGINFSYANFDLQPITGIPNLNIPDSVSHNQCDGTGWGGNAGFLITLKPSTLIGFNYRSATTYNLSGKSSFEGNPEIISDNYHFKLWTPAKSVFSINHFITPKLGFIATLQRIQWSITRNVNIINIATPQGPQNATVLQHLRDTWLMTLGCHYRITPQWILRIAGTYNQSPGNPHYQIVTGDSIILGGSMGYEINKNISIDGSYAHAFIKNQNINIASGRNLVSGVNEASRDGISLKLTFNL